PQLVLPACVKPQRFRNTPYRLRALPISRGHRSVSEMPAENPRAMAARYRESAEAIRGIAETLRFDPRRQNQLRSLAGGFDRAADLIEQQLIKDQEKN